MQRVASKSLIRIAASITLLLLLLLAGSEFIKGLGASDQVDFKVYLTAAQLVREHKGVAIYNDADTGQNPQMRFATRAAPSSRQPQASASPRSASTSIRPRSPTCSCPLHFSRCSMQATRGSP